MFTERNETTLKEYCTLAIMITILNKPLTRCDRRCLKVTHSLQFLTIKNSALPAGGFLD